MNERKSKMRKTFKKPISKNQKEIGKLYKLQSMMTERFDDLRSKIDKEEYELNEMIEDLIYNIESMDDCFSLINKRKIKWN